MVTERQHGSHPFGFPTWLDGDGEPYARLVTMLRHVRVWIEATNLPRLLDVLFTDNLRARALFGADDRLDHAGFLLPPWAKPLVSRAASEAGFPLGHRAFPSALVARELGRIVGRRRLETHIFKAYGRGVNGKITFEAFIPATQDDVVEGWIRGGVCNHVAIAVAEPSRFVKIHDIFGELGVPMSGFMYNRAVCLPDEDATIMYFDLDTAKHPFRIEIRGEGEIVVRPDHD
jgi:hypothetical protein